ncbi:MAG: IS5 family transposase [Burkholderiaceae bacterium]|nr:IS5 family transposase [Burkholderiaceae bacterium]
MIADRRGRPARGSLTAGQVNDVTQALPLLAGVDLGALIGDKAYDSDAVLAHMHTIGARAVIPPRCTRLHQRRYSRKAYRRRNLIERCFCRLKQFRRIATRYEKLAERFVSFVSLVAALCWLA